MKKVMVFGTFDGIHEGHRAMLREAKSLGDYLIVVVAQDHVVKHLKGHLPKMNLLERFEHLGNVDGVDKVAIGDAHLSTWEVVKRFRPDIIGIGHNQLQLKADLEESVDQLGFRSEIKILKHFEPDPHRE